MKIAYNPTTAAALSSAPNNIDVVFDLKGLNIFAKGIKFLGTDDKVLLSATTTSNYRPLILGYLNSTDVNSLANSTTNWVFATTKLYAQPSTGYLWALKLYSGGKEVLTSHQSLSNYVTINTALTITGSKTFSSDIHFSGAQSLFWNNGTYQQKISITDDATSGTSVFNFQLSTNSGSSWTNLLLIYDNGILHSSGYAKNGSSDSYVLLGGGGHKAVSDFATSSSLGNYVTINTTQTITGLKTFSNPIISSYSTNTYLAGNQGKALINSTAGAGAYVMLFKGNSNNGYFTHGVYLAGYLLQYTAKSTVDAGTNSVTRSVTLLNESGNSTFPGTITATKFIGPLLGNADTATKLTTSAGSATRPIYFLDGKPIAGTYTFGNSNGNAAVNNGTLNSNLNADMLDGVHIAGNGGTYGVLRSWKRGSFTSANQYFGNGNIVTIDPIGTGCISANDTILSLGDTNVRNTLLLFAYDRDSVYYRRITSSTYGSWKTLAFTDSTVTNADKLDGVHLNGIFTAFLANGNATRLVIGGVTKDLTIPYASLSPFLCKNSTFNSTGLAGLQYYDGDMSNTTNNNSWSVPSSGWHLILHLPLSVSGYFTELSFPVNNVNGLAWRLRRSSSYYGWYRILDSNNYSSYVKKIGTSTVGSTTKPIYLNAGTPTASNATIGTASRPIYMSGGNLVAGTYTFGNANGNAAINNGTVCTNLNADLLDGLLSTSFMRCDGTNSISLTGGNGNTVGWRLVLEKQCGGWTILNISIAIAARHTGQGILSIGFHTTNADGTTYTYSINFKGSTASLSSGAWRAFYNTSTKKFRLFWYYNDYGTAYINALSRYGFDIPKNGTWYETLPTDNGTELTVYYDNSSTATRLLTARKINGTSFDGTSDITTAYWGTTRTISLTGAITGSVSTNGGSNITINTTYGTGNITNLDNRYVKKAGDTMLGNLAFASGKQTRWTAHGISYITDGNVDSGTSLGGDLANLVISSWYGVSFTTSCSGQTYTNKTAVGINCRTGIVYAANFVGPLQGNASTATQLQTARTINGTSFNGTANIVTSYWGTSRTLTIGNTGKSVNGSGNVSWSLSEIGAAAVNHTHNSMVSKGNLNPQTGRTLSLGDVYSYNTVSGNTGAPTTYTSVIGFGRGTYGTVEIAGGWTSSMGLWYRSLRDTIDSWYSWRPIIDSVNYTNYVKKIGTSSVGSTNVPIYLNGGTPTACPWQFTGSNHQPVILYSGRIYRSGSTWYSDGITVSGAGTLSISRSGALLKLTLSSGIITSAVVHLDSTTSVPNGTSTSNIGGRSEGAFWFGVQVSKSHLVNIRPYYQGNADNDSWISYDSAWTNFIYSITVTLIGYVG